ncbi:hypothetical protein CBR_g45436 [Chara braunii]|nr:hypothetical protein CBR_g45436 [Chara braunii]|eukprot:GBG87379.1 hypothetical protein CBR_g45436 [Chara braunii]
MMNARCLFPKAEWLTASLDFLKRNNPEFPRLPRGDQVGLCCELFLVSDMKDSSAGCLPPGVASLHKEKLQGTFVVQVNEVSDIGVPARERYETESGGPNRCLKLAMTDGKQLIFGIEYRRINSLKVFLPSGIKISIKDVYVRRGMLMLVPENVDIIGGCIEELEEARCRMVKRWNEPPKGRGRQIGPQMTLMEAARAAAWSQTGDGVPASGIPPSGIPENANGAATRPSVPATNSRPGVNFGAGAGVGVSGSTLGMGQSMQTNRPHQGGRPIVAAAPGVATTPMQEPYAADRHARQVQSSGQPTCAEGSEQGQQFRAHVQPPGSASDPDPLRSENRTSRFQSVTGDGRLPQHRHMPPHLQPLPDEDEDEFVLDEDRIPPHMQPLPDDDDDDGGDLLPHQNLPPHLQPLPDDDDDDDDDGGYLSPHQHLPPHLQPLPDDDDDDGGYLLPHQNLPPHLQPLPDDTPTGSTRDMHQRRGDLSPAHQPFPEGMGHAHRSGEKRGRVGDNEPLKGVASNIGSACELPLHGRMPRLGSVTDGREQASDLGDSAILKKCTDSASMLARRTAADEASIAGGPASEACRVRSSTGMQTSSIGEMPTVRGNVAASPVSISRPLPGNSGAVPMEIEDDDDNDEQRPPLRPTAPQQHQQQQQGSVRSGQQAEGGKLQNPDPCDDRRDRTGPYTASPDTVDEYHPFTYLADLIERSTGQEEGFATGRIKGLLVGVKSFEFRKTEKFKTIVWIDDGSAITVACIDHEFVRSLLCDDPKTISANMAPGADAGLMRDTRNRLLKMQEYFRNFEGTMDVKVPGKKEKESMEAEWAGKGVCAIITAMTEGFTSAEGLDLLSRLSKNVDRSVLQHHTK